MKKICMAVLMAAALFADAILSAGFGELGHRSRFNSASGTVNSATYSGEQRRA